MSERKETYRLAIQNEVMSQNLYSALARSFEKHQAAASVFHRLVTMELGHEEKLRKAYLKEYPDSPLIIDENMSHQLELTDISDPVKVLQFAISREEIAAAIYHKMAAASADNDLINLLNNLAQEEEYHKTILETDILRIEGLLTWYDSSELDGLLED